MSELRAAIERHIHLDKLAGLESPSDRWPSWVAKEWLTESARCECCGGTPEACDCDISLVPDSDPSVGYHAEVWWCETHRRKAN